MPSTDDVGFPEYLSPSAVNDLLECPKRFGARYDRTLAWLRRPGPGAALGLIAHAVAEGVAGGVLSEGLDSVARREAVEALWDRHERSEFERLQQAWMPASVPRPSEWPGYQLTRARVIRRVMRRRLEHRSPEGSPMVERWFVDEQRKLRGRPDRVELDGSSSTVVDLKSGQKQREATPPQRRQLLLYAHLVHQEMGVLPERIAIENPAGARWSEPVDEREVAVLIEEVMGARRDLVNRVRNGRSPDARPSADACLWCPYKVVCDEYWDAGQGEWGHGSLEGRVTGIRASAAWVIVDLEVVNPSDLAGQRWTLSGLVEPVHLDHYVRLAGARLEDGNHVRYRWDTVMAVAETAFVGAQRAR